MHLRPSLLALLLASTVAVAQEPTLTPPPVVQAGEDHFAVEETPNKTPRQMVRIRLRDGQELRGELVSERPDAVVLSLVSGGKMELERRSIAAIEPIASEEVRVTSTGEVWFSDPNRTRYFYAPSAMRLKAGESYFSQKELLFSAFAYGISDNVSILVGTILPTWFLGQNGMNFVGALKFGFTVAENLNLAAGAESLIIPFVSSAPQGGGFGFVSATYGTPDSHFTLSAGKPFYFGSTADVGDLLFVAAGSVRVGSNVALMTENWIIPRWLTGPSGSDDVTFVDAVGTRLFGEHWAVDLGLVFIPTVSHGIPIPWIDFTYNFGSKR